MEAINIKIFLKTFRATGQKFAGFYTFYTVAAVVLAICSIISDLFMGEMSQAAAGMDTATLTRFIIYITVVYAVMTIVAAVSERTTNRFSGTADYRLRKFFARYFLKIPYSEFEKKNSGEMLSLYANELPKAGGFLSVNATVLITSLISALASLIYMFFVSPLYTAIYTALLPLIAFVQIKASVPIQRDAKKVSEKEAKVTAVLNDSLQNLSTVAAYSLEDYSERRYTKEYGNYYIAFKKRIASYSIMILSASVIAILPLMFIIVTSGLSVINGSMSLAEFIAFSGIAGAPVTTLTMLSQYLGTLLIYGASAQRLLENTEAPEQDVYAGEDIGDGEPAVKFDNVSFSYDGEKQALDNVSFEIKRGGKVAFVGGSGSGKSTVLKLLLGLYEPQSGNIAVAGKEIGKLSKAGLRGYFAYVPQDSFMLPESIGENILCAKQGERDMKALERACKNAEILNFIQSLPGKFDAVLSEAAENVSGGQRQRISIARAFYKDAPAVLLDEATSALDPITEAEILTSLKTLMENRTVLMVAHRRGVIAACDTIVMMERGRIAGIGSHEELIKSCVPYSELYAILTEEEAS